MAIQKVKTIFARYNEKSIGLQVETTEEGNSIMFSIGNQFPIQRSVSKQLIKDAIGNGFKDDVICHQGHIRFSLGGTEASINIDALKTFL